MKSAIVFFVVSAVAVTAYAQNIQEMISALGAEDSDSLKLKTFLELVERHQHADMDAALLHARAGLAHAREKQNLQGEAQMNMAIARVLERHGIHEQAKEHYEEAKTIFRELGDSNGVADAAKGLGVISAKTGKYDDATRYFLDALELYEKAGNREGVVQTYIKLGVVNDNLGDLGKALEYYLKAEQLNENTPSSNATLTLLNNIGIIYGRRHDLRTALTYFRRGLKQSDPQINTAIHIALLGSLGLAYEKLGMSDSAWYFQQQALSMARTNHLPEEEARSLVNLAVLVQQTDPDQSLALLQQAMTIAQRVQHLILITDIYEAMINLYRETNQYKLAIELADKRQLLKDSLFSIEKAREIANLQATHELARQENEIRHLALQNEKSVFQRNIMLVIAIIAVAMIVIVWFYNTRISNLNAQLIRKQNELTSSNSVKDKLFSILGHDLRAPLNRVIGLLNILAIKHDDEGESVIIEKLKQQSQNTLVTLDNLLKWGQNQLKGIRLDQHPLIAKDQISASIFLAEDSAAQKRVQIVDNVSPEVCVLADPSHFDFVIRNLLSNAIKFSHAGGTVSIDATFFSDDEVIFSIADSGVGIPKALQHRIFMPGNESAKGTWNEKGTGLGLMLCHEYIAENGGRLWVESEEGEGSTFYFSLKRSSAPALKTEPASQVA